MSHTSTVSNVRIVDVNALQAAVQELRNEGHDIQLVQNATPRAYYSNQLSEAPWVIRLNKQRYDVGLYPAEDGRGYEAKCDLWAGEVASVFGAPTSGEETHVQGAIGKLYNRYATHAAMQEAARAGHTCQRVQREDGSTQLVVNLAA